MVVQVIITHKTIPIRPRGDPFSTMARPSAGPCDPCLQANSAATRGGPSRITPGCGKATQRLQLKNVTMNRPLREAVNHCCLEKEGPGLALPRQWTPWRDARAGHALIQSHPRPLGDMQDTHEVTLMNFPCVLQSHCKSGSPRATCISTLEGRRPKVGAPDAETVPHAPVCPQCLGHHGDPEKRHRPRPWSRRDQDDTWADWGEGSCA